MDVKQRHLKELRMSSSKQTLEQSLLDILAVMSVCNAASVGNRRSVRKLSTLRALEKANREKITSVRTKRFTVM